MVAAIREALKADGCDPEDRQVQRTLAQKFEEMERISIVSVPIVTMEIISTEMDVLRLELLNLDGIDLVVLLLLKTPEQKYEEMLKSLIY